MCRRNQTTEGTERDGSSKRRSYTLTLRLLFVASMLVAAVVFGALIFKIISDQEESTAIQTYESLTQTALDGARSIAFRKQQGAESLATFWSYSFPQASQWPFVGYRGFSYLATDVALLSSSAGHGLTVIVRPDQVNEFETHAKQLYEDYDYPQEAGLSDFGFGIWGVDPSQGYPDGKFHDIDGTNTWDNKYDLLMPFLQHKNTFSNPSLLLRNLHQFELRGRLMESIIDCGKAAGPNITISPKCGGVTNFTEIFVRPGPSAVFFNPIFPIDDPSEVVGFIGTSINWAEVLTSIVPDFISGLVCIISNGVESYTYVMNNGVPYLQGKGDFHDEEYEEYSHSTILSDKDTETSESAIYTLTIYPSEALFDEFSTNIPLSAALGFTSVIFVCTIIFFLYDHFMQHEAYQQRQILNMKRRFVRFISHEIRTPMNVVSMGLDLLQTDLQGYLHPNNNNNDHTDATTKVQSSDSSCQNSGTSGTSECSKIIEYWYGLTKEILENSQNAVCVLNDLLNYDKIESKSFGLEIGKVNIWTSLQNTVQEFAIQARNRHINLQLRMNDTEGNEIDIEEALQGEIGNLCVVGDDRRLSQVIRNLISNALKFTPEQRNVTVDITYRPVGLNDVKGLTVDSSQDTVDCETDLHLYVENLKRDGSIVVTVTDEGVGLTKAQLEQLFQEGVQFDAHILQAGGGSGLGLCIAKEIVEMHHGTIVARSEGQNCGTTFEVELPLYNRPVDETGSPSSLPISSIHESEEERCHLVLVVDDVLTNSKMLTRLLERAGHECITASNGVEALEIYKENEAKIARLENDSTVRPIHTILMDFEMPMMNGPEATKGLRDIGCKAFIFGVTGNVLVEDVTIFKTSGADSVLFKPINMAAIDAAWEKASTNRRINPI